MATATATPLLTAEEFFNLPDPGFLQELVRGRVLNLPVPGLKHGYICANAGADLQRFIESRDLGRAMSNNAGVITQRDPDSVRGPDLSYYSFARLPRGPLSDCVGPEIPELVIEVLLPSDRWREIQEKVYEFLNAGVLVVVVLDPNSETAYVYTSDDPPRILDASDELTLPGVLEGFRVPIRRFFE